MKELKDYLEKHYSPSSQKSYTTIIERYLLTLGVRAEKASYKDIVGYIGELRETGLHAKSLRNHLYGIKAYYDYLMEAEKRVDHPCKYLYLKDRIDRQIAIETLASKKSLERFYESYQAKTNTHQRRGKIIVSLLIYQALRVKEIVGIKIEDVKLESEEIRIKTQGKYPMRSLKLRAEQITLISEYLEQDWQSYKQTNAAPTKKDYLLLNREGKQLWTGAINRIINDNRPKTQQIRPLIIRQSVIYHLLKEGADIRIVQAFAGHLKTSTTERYQQNGLEELKLAIETKHPLQ